jgi:hypothetical protein
LPAPYKAEGNGRRGAIRYGAASDPGERNPMTTIGRAALAAALTGTLLLGLGSCSEDSLEGGDCLDLANNEAKEVDCGDPDADARVGCDGGIGPGDDDKRLLTIGGDDQRCVTLLNPDDGS